MEAIILCGGEFKRMKSYYIFSKALLILRMFYGEY